MTGMTCGGMFAVHGRENASMRPVDYDGNDQLNELLASSSFEASMRPVDYDGNDLTVRICISVAITVKDQLPIPTID